MSAQNCCQKAKTPYKFFLLAKNYLETIQKHTSFFLGLSGHRRVEEKRIKFNFCPANFFLPPAIFEEINQVQYESNEGRKLCGIGNGKVH